MADLIPFEDKRLPRYVDGFGYNAETGHVAGYKNAVLAYKDTVITPVDFQKLVVGESFFYTQTDLNEFLLKRCETTIAFFTERAQSLREKLNSL